MWQLVLNQDSYILDNKFQGAHTSPLSLSILVNSVHNNEIPNEIRGDCRQIQQISPPWYKNPVHKGEKTHGCMGLGSEQYCGFLGEKISLPSSSSVKLFSWLIVESKKHEVKFQGSLLPLWILLCNVPATHLG